MPIPRLQVLGAREERFLYDYGWTFTTERLSADLSNPVCKRFPLRRPRVFTHKANRDGIIAPCNSLKFSNWGPYP